MTRNSFVKLWGVAYNGSDRDTVYMAREDGCACRSIKRDTGLVEILRCLYRLREQTRREAWRGAFAWGQPS